MRYSPEEIAKINGRLLVRMDWRNRLFRLLGVDTWLSGSEALSAFAKEYGTGGGGVLTAPLREALLREFPDLRLSLTGVALEPRCLLSAVDEGELFDECVSVVRSLDGDATEYPFVPQILAIRGARIFVRSGDCGGALCADGSEDRICADDGACTTIRNRQSRGSDCVTLDSYSCDLNGTITEIWQTDSAKRFVVSSYGSRDHFSSAKENYLDSVAILFWVDDRKHAVSFPVCVNPNSLWEAGTAHLSDGQYTFRLGRHRTWSRAHIEAVECASRLWPEEWIYEHDADHIRYIALEGTSPINVIRGHGDSLDISEDDIVRAEQRISYFDPTYVDQSTIKINIHTCPYNVSSSLGCQNIAPDRYMEFISILSALERGAKERYGFAMDTRYMLTDASKIVC